MNLRYSNVRHRLTLWYLSAFGLVLLLFILGATLLQFLQLRSQMYHAEVQDVETAEGLLAFAPDGRLVMNEEYHNHPEHILLLDRYMQVLTPDGKVLLRNNKLHNQNLGGRVFAGEGETSYNPRTFRLADGTRLLLISHVHFLDGRALLIRLGYSMQPVEQGVMRFLGVLLLAVIPALLLAGFAGYRMAFKVLFPLTDMARRAEMITATNLQQRLPVDNPHDELGHMARVLNDLFARLEDSFENLKRFTSDASHELRTPLASIRSVGEVALQRLRSPDEYRDTIGSMLEEVTRLTEMVDGLLSISRADAGQIVLHPSTFSVQSLLEDVVGVFGLLAEEKGQRIEVRSSGNLLIYGDRMVLERGVANVVENAIKYSPARSRILIVIEGPAAEDVDAFVDISVEDEAQTIAEEFREKVFARFFRIDAARSRDAGGSGLGLAIAKWAVMVNGGTIRLLERAGGGNRFIIRLPSLGAEPRDRSDSSTAASGKRKELG